MRKREKGNTLHGAPIVPSVLSSILTHFFALPTLPSLLSFILASILFPQKTLEYLFKCSIIHLPPIFYTVKIFTLSNTFCKFAILHARETTFLHSLPPSPTALHYLPLPVTIIMATIVVTLMVTLLCE